MPTKADRVLPTIVALDLSLRSTGVAVGTDAVPWHAETIYSDLKGLARLDYQLRSIRRFWDGIVRPDLVVIEAMAPGMNSPYTLERAGLFYMVQLALWKANIPILLAAPTQVKKFCTGSGRGEKSMMIRETFRKWGVEVANDNEADSVSLLAIGKAWLGAPTQNKAEEEVMKALRKKAKDAEDKELAEMGKAAVA